MLVRDAMSKNVICGYPEMLLREATILMVDNRVGSVIVKKNGRVVGILTEHDVLGAVARSANLDDERINDVMTRYVIYIAPEATLEKAARVMNENKIKKLPVLHDEHLVGIITSTDIVAANPAMVKELKPLIKKTVNDF